MAQELSPLEAYLSGKLTNELRYAGNQLKKGNIYKLDIFLVNFFGVFLIKKIKNRFDKSWDTDSNY